MAKNSREYGQTPQPTAIQQKVQEQPGTRGQTPKPVVNVKPPSSASKS